MPNVYWCCFFRCCLRTHSATMPSLRTITGWFSCKNVSTTQNGNWEQHRDPCGTFFFPSFSNILVQKTCMCCGISPPNSTYQHWNHPLLFIFTPCTFLMTSKLTSAMIKCCVYVWSECVAWFVILVSIRFRLSWEQRCQHQEDCQTGPGEQSLHLLSPSRKNLLSSPLRP